MNARQFGEQDTDAIREYLSSFDLFRGNEAEGRSYINLAFRRFLITLSMIPQSETPGQKLLELGANPYFQTLLIKRFRSYDITVANYFGSAGPTDGCGTQIIRSERFGETHEFQYDHFNAEFEEFPYPDHTFDVLLNCEILEHLAVDPTADLCECQRVLKPGGLLLLTTPNVLAFQNMWRLGANRNVYDQYSGYGVYGRHNREYTPRELIELVEGCGFTLEQIKIADIYPSHGFTRILKGLRQHWRDNLFLLARAKGRPVYYYPSWLYRSMSSLRHIRRSEIVMGENDAVQIGEGWHPLEKLPYPARWSSGKAVAYLRAPKTSDRFTLEVNAATPTPGEIALTVDVAGSTSSHRIKSGEWTELTFPAPEGLTGEVQVTLSVSPTFNPKRLGISEDDRELGLLVKRLGFVTVEPAAEQDALENLQRGIAETQSPSFYGHEYYHGPKLRGDKSGYVSYSASDPAVATAVTAALNIVTRNFAPRRVLELGCAKGFLVDALRCAGIDAWGVDVSSYAIKAAPPSVRPYVAVGSCSELEQPANAFDLIVCNETLEHLTQDNALKTAAEIYRVTAGKAWITTPSMGVNDFGPPNGWPNGKIHERAIARYLNNRDFPDPALIEDLQLDDRGRPIHGHLIAASYRWWTEVFTRQGFIRRGDIELELNKAEPLLSQGFWNSYVFEKPAWDRDGLAHQLPLGERALMLEPASSEMLDGDTLRVPPPRPTGLVSVASVPGLASGRYHLIIELAADGTGDNPWAEVARLEVRSHNERWIHGLRVLRSRDLNGQMRVAVPFSCSAGEDLAVHVYYEGQCGLRVRRAAVVQPADDKSGEVA